MPIIDLPTEILLEIGSHLGFEDLSRTHLSMTCKRFYRVFIPAILKEQVEHIGKLIAESQVIIHKNFGAQKPARVTQREFIRVRPPFHISYSKIVIHISNTRKDLWCVKSLIARAFYLHDVVLQPSQTCSLRQLVLILIACAVRRDIRLTVSGTITGSESEPPFTIQLESAGSLVVAEEKKAVAPAKTVAPPKTVTPASRKRERYPPSLQKVSGLLSKFASKRREERPPLTITRTATPPALSLEDKVDPPIAVKPQFVVVIPSQLHLSSLTIDGGTLFLPALYPFTLNILNCGSIRSLSLSHIRLTSLKWSEILPSITMLTLTKLSVCKSSVAFPVLLAFLDRHPSLETLDLTGYDVVGDVTLPPTDLLPNLNLLIAGSEYIIPFLEHKKLGHFLALQHLYLQTPKDVIYTVSYPYPKHPNHSVYDLLCRGHFTDLCLTLEHFAMSGLLEWLLPGADAEEVPHIRQLSCLRKLVIAKGHLWVATTSQIMPKLLQWVCILLNETYFLIKKRPGGFDSPLSEDHQIVERFIWLTCPHLEILQLDIEEPGQSPIWLTRISYE
ncbi:hypothetical protein GALMADRAFT_245998 [Galerina marginata CBS 339.88]|uniref:F-box domain-containing protein n=1 Tax=Galerina marginata (strain CBS 339.88) TaxID=685588 RepID=A0A067T132_GALM3|nr:hypothetical protein GALMADRAFT_245998 [Galerina marginata CBS 339.88]